MVDACFSELRLAEIYDALEGERQDLELYATLASEVGARSVLDVGCGTGVLACELASRDVTVTGVDPAGASLAVARRKPFADRVRWIVGEVVAYDGSLVDLVTMTGNVAQVFVSDSQWVATLRACRAALKTGGLLVFETRDPEREAWNDWTRAQTFKRVLIAEGGQVNAWCEVTEVRGPVVSFEWTYVFAADRAVLKSHSTLRFRSREGLTEMLQATGFRMDEVRDASDRPGAELVFLARAA